MIGAGTKLWRMETQREWPSGLVGGCYLPDFCAFGMVFRVVLAAELLAFLLVLGPGDLSGDRWTDLGLISMLVQWVALGSSALLCVARRRLDASPVSLVTGIAFGIMLFATWAVIGGLVLLSRLLSFDMVFVQGWERDLLFQATGVVVIVGVVTLRYFYVLDQWRRQVVSESRARLQALQARIRPHFLFNSMNTIASLTRSDPALAESVVLDLADLFRATLADSSGTSRLGEELEVARRYLSIEELRLGERLRVRWAIDALPADALVPALLLQPLLENAVYHGIEPLSGGGEISVEGELRGDQLVLVITNPVGSARAARGHQGHRMALDNTRQRLQAQFHGAAHLHTHEDGAQFVVELEIPYRSVR